MSILSPRRSVAFGDSFRHHAVAVLAGVVAVAVVRYGWHGADLPAQEYRLSLFRSYGFLTFDTYWYAGHYFFTYSLLSPFFAAVVGLPGLGVVSAIAGAAGFSQLSRRHMGPGALPSEVIFAVGTAVPLLVGEITFLAGLAIGLWALVAADRHRRFIALVLGLACTVTSPLAGLFLILALGAWALVGGKDRRFLLVAAAVAGAPLAVSALAFNESGIYRFPVQQLIAVLICGGLGWVIVPKEMRPLRVGLALYAVLGIALFLVPNPVGGNWVRLGSYVAPALVAASCWPHRKQVLVAVLIPTLFWQWSTGVYAVADARGDPSRSVTYFQPLSAELARLQESGRLEIPFTSQHWEAAYMAPHTPLARGWERQLDQSDNPLFYAKEPLTADSYQDWLYTNGVSWVALPDAPLDTAGKLEARLLNQGPSYLQPVWHNAHWRLWRVVGSPGLMTGPGRLTISAPDRFTVDAHTSGTFLVRVHYTRTWTVTEGNACVEQGPSGWTQIDTPTAGRFTITARPFSTGDDCLHPIGPR